MSRNGSGTYNLPAGNPVVTGNTISSSWANTTLSDIASALTGSIAADGQTTPTANLVMGTYAHTGVGNATARTMYASAGQVQDSVLTYLTSVVGTNAITASAPIVMTAYATGQTFRFIAAGASTGAVTININSIGLKSIVRTDGTALVSGDIASGAAVQIMYDGTNFQLLSDANGKSETVTNLTVTGNLTNSALTSGRVTFASTGGLLADSASLTFDGTTLTSTKFAGAFNGTLGATTPSTIAATTGTFSGTNAFISNTATGTTGKYIDIANTSGRSQFGVDNSSGTTFLLSGGVAYSTVLTSVGANPVIIGVNQAKVATFDTSGNLGLGVTPSAWLSTDRAIELTAGALDSVSATDLRLYQNAYNGAGGSVYKTSNFASLYRQTSGQHIFYTAPSGTAGNAITLTTAMTLDASSNLTVTGGATIQGLTVGKGLGGGTNNTAVGYVALGSNTSGLANTAVGRAALSAVTTGSSNTAVGSNALQSSTGSYNTAVGDLSLVSNTTGSNNTAVGYQALYSNTTNNNTAFGTEAARESTTATGIVAVGFNALRSNTGNDNTAVGFAASYTNTTGVSNVSMGIGTLYYNTTGSYNTGLGRSALENNTTASNNTAVGYQAGYSSVGEGNTYLGWQAGYATTGIGNVLLGRGTSTAAAGDNYEIVIGYATAGKGSSTAFVQCNGGGAYQSNNSASWSTTSDQRLKKNIIDNTDGLNKISAIQVRNFEYRLENEITELDPTNVIKKEGMQIGVIAQEIQAILPDCVKEESTGVLSVDTGNLTWYLINAIKELKAEIDLLKGVK